MDNYLHIHGNLYLTRDELQLILTEKKVSKSGKSKGEEYYSNVGYYSNYMRLFTKLMFLGFKDIFIPKGLKACIDYCNKCMETMKGFIQEEKNKRFISTL